MACLRRVNRRGGMLMSRRLCVVCRIRLGVPHVSWLVIGGNLRKMRVFATTVIV
jgi:hypothetical protein